MIRYVIINETDNYNDLGLSFKTLKEAKERIKDLKRFDKENGNPFNDKYVVRKEVL